MPSCGVKSSIVPQFLRRFHSAHSNDHAVLVEPLGDLLRVESHRVSEANAWYGFPSNHIVDGSFSQMKHLGKFRDSKRVIHQFEFFNEHHGVFIPISVKYL
jgi:hypothetical protein